MSKRRRQHKNSLSNLRRGTPAVRPKRACTQRCTSTASEVQSGTSPNTPTSDRTTATKGTSTHVFYGRHNPSPAMATRLDELHDQAVEAQPLIRMARSPCKPRSREEKIMLLQFFLDFLHEHRCTLTKAVDEASAIFRWHRNEVFEICNRFLKEGDIPMSVPLKRGRGSDAFKDKYADTFCKIKNTHVASILEYIRMANLERGGMVTVGRIQAHLFRNFGILFKEKTINKCLTKRMVLNYTKSVKPKLFSL